VIVACNEDLTAVLASMGFDEIFDIVPDHPALPSATEEDIVDVPASQDELLDTMLSAHRTLAGLNEKDRAEFAQVVAMLEASRKQ
jgi:hypothetical protein